MTTIYPNSTAIPPAMAGPNTHLDASQRSFDVYEAYQRALADDEVSLHTLLTSTGTPCSHSIIQISPPLAAILSLTELLTCSDGNARHHHLYETFPSLTLSVLAGTMFELVQALNDGAESLKKRVPNPIGLTAGCELFIGFVTLFPHESAVSQYIVPFKLSVSCDHERISPN